MVIVLVLTSLLAACTKSTSSTTTTASTTVSSSTQPGTGTTVQSTTTTSAAPTNWWDSFGTPVYGGELNWRTDTHPSNYDPYNYAMLLTYPYEGLFMHNWMVDRTKEYSFQYMWTPEKYWTGWLAESWKFADPQTMIINIRQGVHWQNKPPLNGRELTADDLEFHFSRMIGSGHGFTQVDPFYQRWIGSWVSATATDKYTLQFKFKTPTLITNLWSMLDITTSYIEAPELVKKGIKEWQDCIGTGAYVLTNVITNSSISLDKNPDYWGYDEHFPKNKLPYIDKINVFTIPDPATAIAAMRTKKIDTLTNLGYDQVKSLTGTNPELKQATLLQQGFMLILNCGAAPFNDIKVRQALNMSIDRTAMAKSLYGGAVPGEPTGMIFPPYSGYAVPYKDWPQELKDQYTYNPTKAKQLLAEAGYPDGFPTNMKAPVVIPKDTMTIVKSYFADIGVEMEIESVDMAAAIGMLRGAGFDQLFMWLSSGNAPLAAMGNAKSAPNRLNDTVLNGMIEKFLAANTAEEAQKICQEADIHYAQMHTNIELFPVANFTVWQPYMKGYSGELEVTGTAASKNYYWARFWVSGK